MFLIRVLPSPPPLLAQDIRYLRKKHYLGKTEQEISRANESRGFNRLFFKLGALGKSADFSPQLRDEGKLEGKQKDLQRTRRNKFVRSRAIHEE